ncbi:MAG: peptide deformylase [Lachnospiraceae bacterium]|nr:peptide deformylase [Lachnospiraceae bacterium]
MALRTIRVEGDRVLTKNAREVKEVTEKERELIRDMFDTMHEAEGVGLAAPQVGILKKIVVIEVEENEPIVLINPVITETEGSQTGSEGCLSVPGKVGTVTRPMKVVCEAVDENMAPIRVEGEGLLARCICHEVDHLSGHLYTEIVEGPLQDVEDLEEDGEE